MKSLTLIGAARPLGGAPFFRVASFFEEPILGEKVPGWRRKQLVRCRLCLCFLCFRVVTR
jgi:hypothetical protein